ncbi:MAG: hypothetical protein JWR76_1271, partial [Mucilaginibacter sp.]|nr:hypothetical protein [Mucilaginibacter sp.]MDB5286193.1 hypothetical protein [Mucilaginibacter sp.]
SAGEWAINDSGKLNLNWDNFMLYI